MTKLGFAKERIGHERRTGYWIREHLQSEIDQMRHPEFFWCGVCGECGNQFYRFIKKGYIAKKYPFLFFCITLRNQTPQTPQTRPCPTITHAYFPIRDAYFSITHAYCAITLPYCENLTQSNILSPADMAEMAEILYSARVKINTFLCFYTPY